MKVFCLVAFILVFSGCKSQDKNDILVHHDYDVVLIGGWDNFYESTRSKTEVPLGCEKGKVYLSFVVNKNGAIEELEVLKSLCPSADSVALDLVKGLEFKPATMNGEPQRVRKTLPIFFPVPDR